MAIVAAHIRWVERNPQRARFLQQARHTEVVTARAPEIADLNREFGRAIAAWMAPHVAAGSLRASLVDIFIAQLLGPARNPCAAACQAGKARRRRPRSKHWARPRGVLSGSTRDRPCDCRGATKMGLMSTELDAPLISVQA